MRIIKKIVWGLLIVLVLLQFIPASVNKTAKDSGMDITAQYPVPSAVQSVLKKACYDCHSNNTNYPWYARVQPFRLWIDGHVNDGKKELNFSEYGSYSKKKKFNKLRSIGETLKEGTMPLESYRLLHAGAKLTDAEKAAVLKWVDDTRHLMEAEKE
ncbi:MAG: heme-binding domain-containing protein [Chitinophagaceae bacterium]